MATQAEKEVFEQMKNCTSKIANEKELDPSGIVFDYDGTECLIKEETHGVVVSRTKVPQIPSGIFTKEMPTDKYWNFNFAGIDKENYKGTGPCCYSLDPKNGKKLEEYMDIIIGKPKP